MNESTQVVWVLKSDDVMETILRIKNAFDIGELKAIELYAGDGHSFSNKIADHCLSLIGYDIDPDKECGFRKNVPNGEFRCDDSIKMLNNLDEEEMGSFNLVSVDAPACIYGKNYCEHFEILNNIYKLVAKDEKALCVFPVVLKPYDVEKPDNAIWIKRRKMFYDIQDNDLDLNQTVMVYNKIFENQGIKVLNSTYVCREYRNGIDWLYEFIYVLEKK